jgi:hypothetical protein
MAVTLEVSAAVSEQAAGATYNPWGLAQGARSGARPNVPMGPPHGQFLSFFFFDRTGV